MFYFHIHFVSICPWECVSLLFIYHFLSDAPKAGEKTWRKKENQPKNQDFNKVVIKFCVQSGAFKCLDAVMAIFCLINGAIVPFPLTMGNLPREKGFKTEQILKPHGPFKSLWLGSVNHLMCCKHYVQFFTLGISYSPLNCSSKHYLQHREVELSATGLMANKWWSWGLIQVWCSHTWPLSSAVWPKIYKL